MSSEMVQTLAQILAANKQANTQQIGNPQAGQMGFQTGTIDQGYGAVGEAFGKGASDYINQTMVQAQKNKYMQENDPIEIEKRAAKFYDVYNNLPVAEQDKVDKWLNETPDGLKWLDKLNKNAGHLMTKVPLPKDYVAKPGEAPDDITWYRPLRTIKTVDQQRNESTMGMDPAKRENILHAPQIAQLAEAGYNNQRTALAPQEVANQGLGAQAQMTNALANQQQVNQQGQLLPYQKKTEEARASYYSERAKVATAAGDPVGAKLAVQDQMTKRAELKEAADNYQKNVDAISKLGPNERKYQSRINNASYASQVVARDPLSMLPVNLFAQTMNEISGDNQGSDDSLAKNYQMGLNILDMWEANVNSFKSYQALYKAKEKFLYRYYKQRYGVGAITGPDGPEVKKMIQKEMAPMRDKELMYKVMAEEARLRKEKEQVYKLTIPQAPVPDFGGI